MVLVVRCSLCGEILECSKSNRQALFDHIREKHPQIALDTCQNPSKASKLGADSKCVLNDIMQEEEEDGVEAANMRRTSMQHEKKHVSIRPGQHETPPTNESPRLSHIENKENLTRHSNAPQCRREKGQSSTADVLYEREYKKTKILTPKDLNKKKKRHNPKLYRTTVEKWRPGSSKIHCPKCGETRTPIIKSTQNRISKTPAGAACILTCWPFCFLPFLFPPPTHENLYCRSCDFFLGVYDHQLEKARPNIREDADDDFVCPRETREKITTTYD